MIINRLCLKTQTWDYGCSCSNINVYDEDDEFSYACVMASKDLDSGYQTVFSGIIYI